VQLTAKDPADRPGDAAEVARRARQLSERLASGPVLPGPADGTRKTDQAMAPISGWRGSRPRRSAALGGAAAAMIALLVGAAVTMGDPRSAAHPAAAPSVSPTHSASGMTRPASAVVTVYVDGDSLVGQPVSVVVRELRGQGLTVRTLWQPGGQQAPGHVTAIWPAGKQPVGSVVTVVGALRVPTTAAASGQASQPDGGGNGNGNGNGGGGTGNGNGGNPTPIGF
jgi:hypothetical protein